MLDARRFIACEPYVAAHAAHAAQAAQAAQAAHVAMALTFAVANAAAATAAAGAGKKTAQVQLQCDLNNEDDWNKFLARDGLLVVDVYSEWCGPCIGMVGNLKKIKVEIGGDNLHLAVAKSDTIECLKRFRKRSEPTWMFIAAGQLLNVVFGADAPRLARTIEQELRNEEQVRRGERERPKRAPHELTPPEQEVATAQEKLEEQRRARETAAVEEARLARREARAKRLEVHFTDVCPALMMPHAQKNLRKISDALEPYGVVVADKCPILLGKDNARLLAVEEPELGNEATASALAERPSLALLLKKLPEKEENVIELCRRALFGDGLENEDGAKPKKIPAEELRIDSVPGVFVPTDRHQRAAVLDILFPKMVGSLVEPAPPAEPPHICMVYGAWQRRAVLSAGAGAAPRVLRYGFFADGNILDPKLLCKTIEQYELRPEKDYCETIVVMIAVGPADPALAEPSEVYPPGPPGELMLLGPLHVSEDAVAGKEESARFFPPGYSDPDPKPKPKIKKRKKTKRHETKEEVTEEPNAETMQSAETVEGIDAEPPGDGEAEGDGDAEGEGEPEGEGEEEANGQTIDKATSPPPSTPH